MQESKQHKITLGLDCVEEMENEFCVVTAVFFALFLKQNILLLWNNGALKC